MHKKGQGKGRHRNTSGRGFNPAYLTKRKRPEVGQKKNPTGPDGKVMTCSICGSEDHFRANCPRNSGSSPSMYSTYWHTHASEGETVVPTPPGLNDTPMPDNGGPLSQFMAEYGILAEGSNAAVVGSRVFEADQGRSFYASSFMVNDDDATSPTTDDSQTLADHDDDEYGSANQSAGDPPPDAWEGHWVLPSHLLE